MGQNAIRHGLARNLTRGPEMAVQVEALAAAIAKGVSHPNAMDAARKAAEAELEIRRVRDVRTTVFGQQLERQETGDPNWVEALKKILPLLRYERRAVAKRRKALRALTDRNAEYGQTEWPNKPKFS